MRPIVTKSRLKPQLVRKRTVVKAPKTARIVAKQPQTTSKKAKVGENKDKSLSPPKRAVARKRQVLRKSSLQERIRRKKNTSVRYVTRDITLESRRKIQEVRGSGSGRFLVIVGNGPSIAQIELEKLRGLSNVDILSINKPDKRVWPTRYWAFFDRSQLNRHKDLWNSYKGTIFNSTAIKEQRATSMQFKNIGGKGFSLDANKGIHIGRSSVYAAMQIAIWMNYDKVFIFGCDMNPDGIDGKLHFYGVNPDVDPKTRAKRFEREAAYYDVAAEALEAERRQQFVFCSKGINPWPFMNEFSSIKHTAAIDHIINLSES